MSLLQIQVKMVNFYVFPARAVFATIFGKVKTASV